MDGAMRKDFSFFKELPKERKGRSKFLLLEIFKLRMDNVSDSEVTNQQKMDRLDRQAPVHAEPQETLGDGLP